MSTGSSQIVKTDEDYLRESITHLIVKLGNFDINNFLSYDNNMISSKEMEAINKINNGINELSRKIRKQLLQFRNAGTSLKNIDNFLDEEALKLDLDEVNVDTGVSDSIKEIIKDQEETFDNLLKTSDLEIYDITRDLGSSSPVYFSVDESNNTYIAYVKINKDDDVDEIISGIKDDVCAMIDDMAGEEYAAITYFPKNDIQKCEYKVKDDYVIIVLPKSFDNLRRSSITYMHEDPLDFLDDRHLVRRNV